MSDGDIRLGIQIRTQGPQSDAAIMVACAEAAERAGLDDIVVVDHIAIPPDDIEGSGGRYLDPLGALLFLAAKTSHIGLGTGVLVLPYRPILPTAKVVATLQELSGCRLRLGVGVGWMPAEFNALGVPRNQRGRLFNEGLEFLNRAFASDRITENGQDFMFLPRPMRPPLLIGGTPPYAFNRAVAHG
ncbi:MAG: LLM class flavin-dependent oxidoreductase, partial [Gammaproteobacteria bacterium]|nr:LLM class flavin-dependent oxidoreductase [Gammaproteobacteria bacterium]